MCQARQVQIVDRDWFLRQIAFRFLEDAVSIHGDDLPFRDLNRGIAVEEGNLTLAGQRGIWKPAVMHLPLSIRTGATDPYGDEVGDDGFLHYRYYGTDPQHPDNAGLRRCFNEGRPLIYFRALAPGRYSALWPVVIVNDDPGSLTFTLDPDRDGPAPPGTVSSPSSRRVPKQLHRVPPQPREPSRCGAHHPGSG
jgi:putative restriction endonuclease